MALSREQNPQETSHLSKIENVDVPSTVIFNPKANITYHIKTSGFEARALKVTFLGKYVPNFTYVDLTTGFGGLRSHPETHITLNSDNFGLFGKEILPQRYHHSDLFPVVVMMMTDKAPRIYELSSITYTYDNPPASQGVLGKSDFTYFQPALDIKLENSILQTAFQKLITEIPVQVGMTPIFEDEKKPSYSTLKNTYDLFLKFNNKEKLAEQYKVSEQHCYLRAHFVNVLLSTYGISSLKVFKFWNAKDWATYEEHDPWDFHAAAMIRDDKGNGWVWDPWQDFNQQLLPFKEWVIQKNEPLPVKVTIHHQFVISDIVNGRLNESIHFNSTASDTCFKIFKAVALSAAADLPGEPLASEKFGFFKTKVEHKECSMVKSKQQIKVLSK